MSSTPTVNSRAELAAVSPTSTGLTYNLAEAPREGVFEFQSGNLSAEVARDPLQGMYVAPSSSPLGQNGAWVRKIDGLNENKIRTRFFGARHDDETDDKDALNAAVKYVSELPGGNGGELTWSPGIALVSEAVFMRDFVKIEAEKPGVSGIRNPGTEPAPHRRGCFRLGYWAIQFNGERDLNGGTGFARKIKRYITTGRVAATDTSVVLDSANNAADFIPGRIYYLRSEAVRYNVVERGKPDGPAAPSDDPPDQQVEIPLENSLVRVTAVNGQVVTFEKPAGFDTADYTPDKAYLCRILGSAQDQSGDIPHFVQDVEIHGLYVSSQSNIATAIGMYNWKISNITGELRIVVGGNGCAWGEWDGYEGTFTERLCEVKFCSHNSVFKNIIGTCIAPAEGVSGSMVSFGEQIRDCELTNFRIDAPTWNKNHIVTMIQARRCRAANGQIFAPDVGTDSTGYAPILFGFGKFGPEQCRVDNVELFHNATVHVAFQRVGVDAEPGEVAAKGCTVSNVNSISRQASVAYAVRFNGGEGNEVLNSRFNNGGQAFFTPATGNSIRDSVFGSSTVFGTAVAVNSQSGNSSTTTVAIPATP